MPILLLLGPRFGIVERQYNIDGQCWPQIRQELVARDQRLSKLLPQSTQDAAAKGVAYFINGQRMRGKDLFKTTFMPSDELMVVSAISGG